MVNNGNKFSGKTITLGADIDRVDHEWTHIGNSSSNSLEGTFNGKGHTISNLVINGAYGAAIYSSLP